MVIEISAHQIDVLTEKAATLNTQLGDANKAIGVIDSNIASANQQLTDINSKVKTVSDATIEISAAVTANANVVNESNAKLDSLPTINDRLDNIDKQLTVIKDTLEKLTGAPIKEG